MRAVVEGLVHDEGKLRREAQADTLADLAADEAERTLQSCPAILDLLFTAHEAHVDLGLAQIARTLDGRDRHETDARVLELTQDDL